MFRLETRRKVMFMSASVNYVDMDQNRIVQFMLLQQHQQSTNLAGNFHKVNSML